MQKNEKCLYDHLDLKIFQNNPTTLDQIKHLNQNLQYIQKQ